MRLIKLFLVVSLLAGCASQGSSQQDMSQARVSASNHTELAAAYYERKQYAISLQELGIALQADSSFAPAYNVRALVRMALGEDDKAEADFRRSLDLDRGNSETRNNYGWFMCQRGRAKESLDEFREALKNPLYATPELAYLNLGICSREAGMLKEAGSYLHRALILRPGMPEALYTLAKLDFDNADYAGAKSWWLRFTQTSPDLNAEQLWLGVRIERRMRDRNSEASYALQLRKRYPDSREAQLLQRGE